MYLGAHLGLGGILGDWSYKEKPDDFWVDPDPAYAETWEEHLAWYEQYMAEVLEYFERTGANPGDAFQRGYIEVYGTPPRVHWTAAGRAWRDSNTPIVPLTPAEKEAWGDAQRTGGGDYLNVAWEGTKEYFDDVYDTVTGAPGKLIRDVGTPLMKSLAIPLAIGLAALLLLKGR